LRGIGLFPEAIIQNPIVYEAGSEIAWWDRAPGVTDWFHDYVVARYGRSVPPADAAWDIMLAARPNRAMALYLMMNEDDVRLALRQPWVSIGTDAASVEKLGEMDVLGLPHPRSYGTFPRVIAEYARDQHVLSLEDAVRKMTSLPAARMGLGDRGVLREGLRADVTIFNYDKIREVADWTHPTGIPVGIDAVIVNGVIALDHGTYTGAKSGSVLRHECPAPANQ